MNTLLIVFLVVIVIAALIYVFLGTTAVSNKNISLLSKQDSVEVDKKQNIRSVHCTYAFWINIQSWSNNDKKTILEYGSTGAVPKLSVYVDPTDSNMYCDVMTIDNNAKTILISNNFQLQRWVHVVISLEDRNVDCYVNGRMTNATLLEAPQSQLLATESAQVKIGGDASFDAYIQKLTRVPKTVDPYTVWVYYLMDYMFVATQPITKNLKVALLQNNTVAYEATIM
jgi:uncharacterized protein YxeA